VDDSRLYHAGSRQLQDLFDSRRIADRLEERNLRQAFTDADRRLIESAAMFFLATVGPDGYPDVSYKGGMPGFVRVVGESTLAFPHYDGNGMFKSLGNVLADARVGLVFVRWIDAPKKLRVQGRASVHEDDPLLAEVPGAQLITRVQAERIFDNCPRYLHRMRLEEHSVYAPRPDHEPPEPEWKRRPEYRDAISPRGRAS
jgi:predicted pyridoxine 5'-phosphate oxidase superfamily flavin-nucleotide-binding protein